MLNQVHLIGRLANDVKEFTTKNGTMGVEFTVAVDKKKNDHTEWVPCKAWRNLAENMQKYTGKGDLVHVEGEFRTYTSGEGANKQWHSFVDVTSVDFLDSKRNRTDV